MGTLSTIRRYAGQAAGRFIAAHRRRQTLRALESLDRHVLKDIGWHRDGTTVERVR